MLNKLMKYIANNFGKPNGIGGIISTKIMNVINQPQYNSVLENIDIKEKDCILDIGFGNGYLIKKLLDKNISAKLYGIEISQDMIEKVSSKYIGNNNVRLLLEDINKTSFEQNIFDKIYTVNTIYFWNELGKCFSEIKRVLKSNGKFLNVIYTKEYLDKIFFSKYGFNKYTIDEIKNITENNRLKIIGIKEIRKNKSYCIISENIK
jgi:SAM-dependent methyltransferase